MVVPVGFLAHLTHSPGAKKSGLCWGGYFGRWMAGALAIMQGALARMGPSRKGGAALPSHPIVIPGLTRDHAVLSTPARRKRDPRFRGGDEGGVRASSASLSC